MSGLQAKPFKARLGLDANNEKVINVKDPSELMDALNLQYFVASNTVQSFVPSRTYPAGFIVERADRLYKSKTGIGAGSFNLSQWTEVHAFDLWQRITGNLTAEPGNCIMTNTSAGSLTITLPEPDEGDIVTVLDEGFASNNPVNITAVGGTFVSGGTTYSINSSDIVRFMFLGGKWLVDRIAKETFQYLTTGATVKPNSWNIVNTSTAKTITLPVNPIQGQWVVVADGSNNARSMFITIDGNGKSITGSGESTSATRVLNQYGQIATLVFDATLNLWVITTSGLSRRIPESNNPFVSESVIVTLDTTAKTMTLPTANLANGDWVEVIAKTQDEIAAGSLVVSAGGSNYFRNNGGTQNTTAYRIRGRGRYMFVYKTGEWTVIADSETKSVPSISSGNMISNSLVKLVGAAGQTIYLPQADQVQIGDVITTVLNTVTSNVVVSVQSTSNDLLDAGTNATYVAADNGQVLIFVYRGWNGTKYVWETINTGAAYLKKTSNGGDIPDKAAFRSNIDVFNKAESDARFLAINGTADNAVQAENSDKLDNLDSKDFIQVKNPTTTAVDANTTNEARFTTNVNTPDATSWQVVMFVDKVSGDKAQIALSRTTTKIGYRSFSGSTWTLWSYLDQAANAATATKLLNARTINGVAFDGTANINILANPITTPILAATDLDTLTTAGKYYCSANAIAETLVNCPTTMAFTMDVSLHAGCRQQLSEYMPSGVIKTWFRNKYTASWSPWFRIYSESDPQPNVTGNAGTATKWQTPRTLTFTGGLTGSGVIDGSANVSIATTVNPSAHTHTISDVTGLQAALDGKLAVTGKAADADKLDGIDGADYSKCVASAQSGEDPNTTTTSNILTNHANTPNPSFYWFITTNFYSSRSASSNRFQFASQYNGGASVSFRQNYGGTWTDWVAISAIAEGSTYNISVTGNAGTADSAATATKLTTARNINDVLFDGTADITVEDGTKLPLTGGTLTGGLAIETVGNSSIELGRVDGVASTPFFDFHSGATATDYDVRLIASAGDGTAGGGNLGITAQNVTFSGAIKMPLSVDMYSNSSGMVFQTTSGTVVIGNRNGSYTHYDSSSTNGHYFYKNVAVAGTITTAGATVSGTVSAGTIDVGGCTLSGSTYNFDSWVRTTGATGWYSTTYGGGWSMNDTTWIRAYGSKALLVSNQIAATGNITAYYSDKRLKENLKQITNAVDTVKAWTGYHYNANVLAQSFGYDPNKKEIGLLAQDVQATTPEAVEQAPFDVTEIIGKSLTGQNYLTLKYDRLVPILVEAIKEQDAKIQQQEDRISALEKAIEKLLK